jgi:hypothetical protein
MPLRRRNVWLLRQLNGGTAPMTWFVDKLGPNPRAAGNAANRGAAPQKSAPAPQAQRAAAPQQQRAAAPPPKAAPAPEPEKKKKKGWF